MSKDYTLEDLELLSNKKLSLLIPEDIDYQFSKLPVRVRVFPIKGLKSEHTTPRKVYHIREGYINLLNENRLYIYETNLFYGGIK